MTGKYRTAVALLVGLLAFGSCKDDKSRRPPVIASPTLSAAEIGDRHYERGEYVEAASAYESALAEASGEPARSGLAFRLAMSYMTLTPGADGQKMALELLRRELSPEAAGAHNAQASLLLDLLESLERLRTRLGNSEREARRLASELEKLRAIDLQRRPPEQ